jgi:hypothetical protein
VPGEAVEGTKKEPQHIIQEKVHQVRHLFRFGCKFDAVVVV